MCGIEDSDNEQEQEVFGKHYNGCKLLGFVRYARHVRLDNPRSTLTVV